MNALLVSPSQAETFFNYQFALRFVKKKAALPPLGLLTVAAMLPAQWSKKVIDMNVEPLTQAHLKWADMVFISAMVIQKESTLRIISMCRAEKTAVVAGGPLFTHLYKDMEGVDHFIIGEAEEILPVFLEDLEKGRPRKVYQAEARPDLAKTPIPSWDLLNFRQYHGLSIQFSRGCPFDCEFCDIVQLFGRRPRFKTPDQVTAELDALYRFGWRGAVMFVDDNFIAHKSKTIELLQNIISWQRRYHYPFVFNTQASVNLAREPVLMAMMNEANMDTVFLGIETPALESLKECEKKQNQDLDLVAAVKAIQANGITVSGGFIIGFDSDPDSIFDDQVRFIERAGIPTAMVGLLSVGPGTRLYDRLRSQGRLLGQPSGNNTMDSSALNFIPVMNREKLIAGYKSVLRRLYEPKAYYRRVLSLMKSYGKAHAHKRLPPFPLIFRNLLAAARIFWRLGVLDSGRLSFWMFLLKVGATRPTKFSMAMNFAAVGYHYKMATAVFVRGR